MKLYTYNNLELDYTELSKEQLINLLITGNRKNIYIKVSASLGVANDRYYFNRAKDKDIKEFLQGHKKELKVKVDVDMAEVKQYVTDNIELLNHDIVIGINKDLELPTVFIDGEEVKGKTELLLHWESEIDPTERDNKFKIQYVGDRNEGSICTKELRFQTTELRFQTKVGKTEWEWEW